MYLYSPMTTLDKLNNTHKLLIQKPKGTNYLKVESLFRSNLKPEIFRF